MNGIAGTKGVAFCWQDKKRLAAIRIALSGKRRTSALVVYLTLTNISSDYGDSRFPTFVAVISEMSGLHRETVRLALDALQSIGLITVHQQVRTTDGRYSAVRVTITKGALRDGFNVSKPPRSEPLQQAIPNCTSASISHSHRDGFSVSKPTYIKKKKEKEVVVTRAREEEPSLTLPEDIQQAIETHDSTFLTPAAARVFCQLIEEHGAENVRAAIRAAADHLVERRGFTSYVRRALENQKALGYTWKPVERKRRGGFTVTDLSHISPH